MSFHFALHSHSRDLGNFILNPGFIACGKTLVLSLIWIVWLQAQWSKYFEVWRVLGNFVTVHSPYSSTNPPISCCFLKKPALWTFLSLKASQLSFCRVHSMSSQQELLCIWCGTYFFFLHKKTRAILSLLILYVIFFCKQLLQIGLNWETQFSPFKVCANISKDFCWISTNIAQRALALMELSTHWDTKAAQTPFFRSSSVFQPPAQCSVLAWAWGETVNSEEMLKLLSSLDSTAVALAWKSLQEAKAMVCAVQGALAVTHLYLFLSAACASPPRLHSMETV